jgi:hypothetical protein
MIEIDLRHDPRYELLMIEFGDFWVELVKEVPPLQMQINIQNIIFLNKIKKGIHGKSGI